MNQPPLPISCSRVVRVSATVGIEMSELFLFLSCLKGVNVPYRLDMVLKTCQYHRLHYC